jgi:hypothetical protein
MGIIALEQLTKTIDLVSCFHQLTVQDDLVALWHIRSSNEVGELGTTSAYTGKKRAIWTYWAIGPVLRKILFDVCLAGAQHRDVMSGLLFVK